jgi:hypothetical protein
MSVIDTALPVLSTVDNPGHFSCRVGTASGKFLLTGVDVEQPAINAANTKIIVFIF